MLRYIKHNLTGIDGVELYPILSLLIFVLFFSGVLWYVIRMSKKEVTDLSEMPLEDGTETKYDDAQLFDTK